MRIFHYLGMGLAMLLIWVFSKLTEMPRFSMTFLVIPAVALLGIAVLMPGVSYYQPMLVVPSAGMVTAFTAFVVLGAGLFAAGAWLTTSGRKVLGSVLLVIAGLVGAALVFVYTRMSMPFGWSSYWLLYPLAVCCVAAPLMVVRQSFTSYREEQSMQPLNTAHYGRSFGERHDGAHWQADPHSQQAPGGQPAAHEGVASNPPAGMAQGSSIFDVSLPSRTLASIAGMSQLKADLAPVLAKFRPWGEARFNRKAPPPVPVDRNGILFTGPPGNGKSTMAEAIAGELRLPLLRIGVQDLTSKWVNESTEKVAAVVSEAIAIAPCVLFIDEIDAVAPRRDEGNGSHQENKKVVNTLLQQIDRLRKKCVLLIGATNYLENIDSAVVRDGRFDFRIEIPWPDEEARLGIFSALASKHGLQVPPDVAAKAAHRWERRSAAFIENVAKLLRDMPEAKKNPVDHAMVRAADRAVSKRAGNLPRGGAKLSELHLLPDVQRQAGSIVSRLAHWDEIAEQGGTPPRGVLLYGPPGTGKTHLINAIARELGDWHVFEVRTAEILADPRSFTKVIELATAHRPAFVFIDEADDLLKDRNASFNATATNEILKAMDGAIGAIPEVVFVAATNNPEAIDAAAKRSGRFSEKLLLDVFRGDDLVRFVSNWIDANGGRLNLDASVTAEGIAACIGAAGPADVIGILNTAVNATFDGSQGAGLRRSVVLSDIERATHELRAV